MEKQTMTIHEALSELKTLDKRIFKKITEFTPCVANKHSNDKIKGIDIASFKDKQRAEYQAITDLINRRINIKKALVLSNATTKITIDGIEYTVAEAIEMKQSGIELWSKLYENIASDYSRAQAMCVSNNDRLNEAADEYVIRLLGGDGKGTISTKVIDDAKNAYIESNKYDLVEAIHCEAEISVLENRVNKFLTEVDAALSVSNALTCIEI